MYADPEEEDDRFDEELDEPEDEPLGRLAHVAKSRIRIPPWMPDPYQTPGPSGAFPLTRQVEPTSKMPAHILSLISEYLQA